MKPEVGKFEEKERKVHFYEFTRHCCIMYLIPISVSSYAYDGK
jgi:hypothetical protein